MSSGPQTFEHQVLHGEHHAEGGEQLEQLRHAIDAPQQHELHEHADHADAERRQQDARRQNIGKAVGDVEQARDRCVTPK